VLFISPGDMLYEGMVIGENAKPQDLEVNALFQFDNPFTLALCFLEQHTIIGQQHRWR
jgi:hypothetical protein